MSNMNLNKPSRQNQQGIVDRMPLDFQSLKEPNSPFSFSLLCLLNFLNLETNQNLKIANKPPEFTFIAQFLKLIIRVYNQYFSLSLGSIPQVLQGLGCALAIDPIFEYQVYKFKSLKSIKSIQKPYIQNTQQGTKANDVAKQNNNRRDC